MVRTHKRPLRKFYATVREVAKVTRTDIFTVRRWCTEARICARKTPGDNWRIEVDQEGWPLEPGITAPPEDP